MNRRISVVIPTYNYGRFIAEAIESVLQQTYPRIEIIVVDDGSTDNTEKVLSSFGDRIRYIRQANQGVGAARNTGVKESSGELIAFLDADDYWHPQKLEKQVEKLVSDPEIGLVHCGLLKVDASGNPLEENCAGKEGWVADDLLLFEPVIAGPGSCTLVRKEIFLEVGGYDLDMSMHPSEDWELSYRIARKCKFGFVREPLVFYRHHGGGGHEDIPRMEKSTRLAWGKIFETVDPGIVRLRRQSYANLYKVLAGSYLHVGRYQDFLRNLLKSLWFNPSLMGYYLKVLKESSAVKSDLNETKAFRNTRLPEMQERFIYRVNRRRHH